MNKLTEACQCIVCERRRKAAPRQAVTASLPEMIHQADLELIKLQSIGYEALKKSYAELELRCIYYKAAYEKLTGKLNEQSTIPPQPEAGDCPVCPPAGPPH